MRQFKKVLARAFPAFPRHFLLDYGAEIRERRSITLKTSLIVKKLTQYLALPCNR